MPTGFRFESLIEQYRSASKTYLIAYKKRRVTDVLGVEQVIGKDALELLRTECDNLYLRLIKTLELTNRSYRQKSILAEKKHLKLVCRVRALNKRLKVLMEYKPAESNGDELQAKRLVKWTGKYDSYLQRFHACVYQAKVIAKYRGILAYAIIRVANQTNLLITVRQEEEQEMRDHGDE
jgi:hypothetical protein